VTAVVEKGRVVLLTAAEGEIPGVVYSQLVSQDLSEGLRNSQVSYSSR